jgi:hypothetical protein
MENSFKVRWIGTRPLLMHADTLADPLHPRTKAHKQLTAKRKKTDEDQELIAKSEWLASLYFDEKDGPIMPSFCIEACITTGAKATRMGKVAKQAMMVREMHVPIEYKGPRDPEKMWEAGMYDARSVKVTTSKIMRYRPIFKEWSLFFTVDFDPEKVNKSEILDFMAEAGRQGLCDYRPKFGRFEVQEVK